MTTINGFNGIFSPVNWNQLSGSGTASFNSPINTELVINKSAFLGFSFGLSTSPPTLNLLPKGKLTFTYKYSGSSGWFYNANGIPFFPSLQNDGTISNIQIDNNGSFAFLINGGGSAETLTISSWQFIYDEEGPTGPTGPTGPIGDSPTGPTGPIGNCSQLCNFNNLQFGYSINGGPDVILTSESPLTNSGNVTLNMTAGDVFCFKVLNLGNVDGNCALNVDISCFEYKENYPCFKKGSKILCYIDGEERYIPIENIRKGTLVKTLKSGYVPVDMIGTSILYNNGTSENILYNCNNDNYPEVFEDLYITGHHSILVENLTQKQVDEMRQKLGRLYITEGKWRLLACLDERAIPVNDFDSEIIYHIALENNDYYMNYGIYANGLLVESSSKRYLKELSNMKLIE